MARARRVAFDQRVAGAGLLREESTLQRMFKLRYRLAGVAKAAVLGKNAFDVGDG